MKRGTPWSFYELKVAKDAYVKYWIFKFFVYLCSILLH